MKAAALIPTEIVPSVTRSECSPRSVEREFQALIDGGAPIKVAGLARTDPSILLKKGLKPKHKIELFDTQFYFTHVRQIPELRFFVCYIVQAKKSRSKKNGSGANASHIIYPRIVYKDLSLSWRAASHFTFVDQEIWIGKGDVTTELHDGHEMVVSAEATTDLPTEMQTAVESLIKLSPKPPSAKGILDLVLKRAANDRVEPYQEFVAPRRLAQSNQQNLINRNRSIARFTRRNDPHSLKFTAGFEPDFKNGIIEASKSKSRLYGGTLRRFRILSSNRQVQYFFIAGATHVWIFPPQATTTELSSFGVRTIDVIADDDLFIPGYEYHHFEETKNGPELYSQIPPGYAGEVCAADDAKADASPWLNEIPIIQAFRREVLQEK
ncbi:MAG: hypothetical protein AB8B55_01310 [Mariniblastus sp.]